MSISTANSELQEERSAGFIPLLDLPMARYVFSLAFHDKVRLPDYPSLSLRGLLGRSLHRLVCPLPKSPESSCKVCFLQGSCPYYRVFEQQSTISGRSEATKGYVVYVAPFPAGRYLSLELTLFGRVSTFFPVLYAALEQSGKTGIGRETKRKKTFHICGAFRMTPDGPISLKTTAMYNEPAAPFSLRQWLSRSEKGDITFARFTTPVNLAKKAERNPDWRLFYGNLVRRLEGLDLAHGSGEGLGKDKWLELKLEFAAWPDPVSRLNWTPLERYSGRQGQKHPLGGFTGDIDLRDLSVRQKAWWQVAGLIHVGRGAVMGMGRVEVR